MRMEKSEGNEVSEGTKETLETPPLETLEAKEVLESTEKTFCESFENLSPAEKLDTFRELEVKCADLEGRDPRAVEDRELKGETFRSSEEKVEIDKGQLSEMKNMDEERISDLKKHVFSTAEVRLNHGSPVSFGRTCSEKCRDNDVPSGICRYG